MTRTVVIGGVGPTLGESLARRFANEGDRVALWARSDEFTGEVASELTATTPGAVETDVTEPAAVERGADRVREAFGPVGVYVHNTPVPGWNGPDDDPADLLTTVETVGYGFALVVDELLPDLRETGGTVIHNTGEFVKWVSRRLAERLAPEGVHVVHATIDGWIDAETVSDDVPDEKRADPDEIAVEFCRLVEQDRDVWTFDVDFRPWGDDTFRTRE